MPDEKELQETEDTGIRDAIAEAMDNADDSNQAADAGDQKSDDAVSSEDEESVETSGEEGVSGDADDAGESDVSEDDESRDGAEEPPIDAPAHWKLEQQEHFRALDPKSQKVFLETWKDMEAAHTKRSQEIAPLRNTVSKWQPYLDKVGATAEQAFDTLIAAEYTLRTGTEAQKREAFLKLGKDYGISLEEPKANGAEQDFLTADIQKAVQPLQQELGTLRQTILQRDQSAQQAQADKLAETVRLFREAKTEAGQPANPYFDEVWDDMARLAKADEAAGKISEIADIYERAIWSNPTVRAKLLASQQHAAKLKEKREHKEKVKKAKAADVSVTGVSSAPKEQPKSLRTTIEEAAAGSL